MSEFKVEVIEIGEVEKHPDADALDIVHVHGGYPCITRLGQFKTGDKAVYIPVDAVVPTDDPRFAFLAGKSRIKAKKIRGVFSMGLLIDADQAWEVGQDVCELLGITKYEPPLPIIAGGDDESDPGFLPVYTDIEGMRRWPDVLQDGEDVIIMEKLHGCNARYCWRDGRLWCGSHHKIKKPGGTVWWRIAEQYGLAEKLEKIPDMVLYGEIFGRVQDLHYGSPVGGLQFAAFDAYEDGGYWRYDAFKEHMEMLGIPTAPELYRGAWSKDLMSLAEGESTWPGAKNIREGVVVRSTMNRFEPKVGRVILKLIGQGYLLR